MPCSRSRLPALVLSVLAACLVPACKDKKEVVSEDLADAGFKMTPEDWFRASRENNAQAMKRFVAGGFPADTKDTAGDTALHAAASAGAIESADFLLKKGVPVDVPGAERRTPLMVAVVADKRPMVNWLLRQGADPLAKDAENFTPLKLAVREGSAASISELAAYDREDLDPSLLLAALLGRTEVIDSLTNYGASVYARMDEDRTPLMLAAQNGHMESVKLLLDLGSSRHAVNAEGKTAAQLATEAGHPEVADAINRDPAPKELSLESPAEVSAEMDEFVAGAENEELARSSPADAGKPETSPGLKGDAATPGKPAVKRTSRPIDGAVLAPVTANSIQKASAAPARQGGAPSTGPGAAKPAPVIMRHYREADVPIEVMHTTADTATLRISGARNREVKVKAGDTIPGSRLMLVNVKRRMESSKVTDGKAMEVSVVEVQDPGSGVRREWISGRQSTAHDPIALVEDPASGERYTARPGQRFRSADGGQYLITDVRPNQIVIQDLSDGTVQTVPLKGPRG